MDCTTPELKVLKCNKCQKLYLPPKYICSQCNHTDFSTIAVKGDGEIFTFTTIRMPFDEFKEEAPFSFAEVVLNEGLVVPARISNEDKKIKIGSKVSFDKEKNKINWFNVV